MKSRKIVLLSILAGTLIVSTLGLTSCTVPRVPYDTADPFEAKPTDAATNNNTFGRASALPLTNNRASIYAVLTLHDVDVYNLGSAAAGDRLVVDIDIPDRVLLNAAVGVFDSVGRVFYLNQEVTQTAAVPLTDVKFPAFAPHFEFVVRQATSPLYLAVASLPETSGTDPNASEGYTGGPYTIDLQIQRGGPIPLPVKQVVALQFDDSTIDYPPFEDFGDWSDIPPIQFTGLNGRVLDPAWWRPFTIMGIVMQSNQNNQGFWQNFLTWLGTAGLNPPGMAAATPATVYGILAGEFTAALQAVSTNPTGFVPANPPNTVWFLNNGYPWLYDFSLYLGPGNAQAAGLNIWNSVLPSSYPANQDPAYDDFIGLTDVVKQKLEDMYAGLNIEFLVVGIDPIPTNVPVQRLYIVSNSLSFGILGLASTLDIGNQNRSDFAAIFAGELGFGNAWALGWGVPNVFGQPDLLMQDLGFVCGHELGHNLGLVHTNSTVDVMKRYGGDISDLTAYFGNAPLDSSMFPIGTQDSGLLLLLELGLP